MSRYIRMPLCIIASMLVLTVFCHAAEQTYIAGYSLSVATWVKDHNTDVIPKADITITVTDSRLIPTTDFTQTLVTATPHNGSFYAEAITQSISGSTYDLIFHDVAYLGGTSDFSFDISYDGLTEKTSNPEAENADPITQPYTLPTLTLTQHIGQCHTIEKSVEPEPVIEYFTPSIQILSVVCDQTIIPGEDFTLTVTIGTTNGNENLTDTWVQLNLPDGYSSPVGKTGATLNEVGPQATRTIQFNLHAMANLSQTTSEVSITATGTGIQSRTPVSTSGSTRLTLLQPDRFELLSVSLPSELSLNTPATVTAQCVNKGKTTIYNLSGALYDDSGNLLYAQYLGNAESGQVISVELPFTPETTGNLHLVLELSYETENGESKLLRHPISANIPEPTISTPYQSPIVQVYDLAVRSDSAQPPFWCWILLIVLCIITAVHLCLGWLRQTMEYRQYISGKH